ncbi:hypothetical protein NADFUDRAFT_63949 [Nadsonia fulvescens var. elongata DSM 6958]|uniref:GATA-type domain-containing protein n=1 Tax=Nadsonia fulvescens var. elongata DSM 6958 TaxID=857566 RepID=A0A1E3PUK2_9ASCO|nr:hypothetical protein NADFUDRAFT_63949 [Nadsonia fulvescens var. elongata DSM 6958]
MTSSVTLSVHAGSASSHKQMPPTIPFDASPNPRGSRSAYIASSKHVNTPFISDSARDNIAKPSYHTPDPSVPHTPCPKPDRIRGASSSPPTTALSARGSTLVVSAPSAAAECDAAHDLLSAPSPPNIAQTQNRHDQNDYNFHNSRQDDTEYVLAPLAISHGNTDFNDRFPRRQLPALSLLYPDTAPKLLWKPQVNIWLKRNHTHILKGIDDLLDRVDSRDPRDRNESSLSIPHDNGVLAPSLPSRPRRRPKRPLSSGDKFSLFDAVFNSENSIFDEIMRDNPGETSLRSNYAKVPLTGRDEGPNPYSTKPKRRRNGGVSPVAVNATLSSVERIIPIISVKVPPLPSSQWNDPTIITAMTSPISISAPLPTERRRHRARKPGSPNRARITSINDLIEISATTHQLPSPPGSPLMQPRRNLGKSLPISPPNEDEPDQSTTEPITPTISATTTMSSVAMNTHATLSPPKSKSKDDIIVKSAKVKSPSVVSEVDSAAVTSPTISTATTSPLIPTTTHPASSLRRQCISCGSDQSPCWRPSWSTAAGQLCNSCGLRYKKTNARCLVETCGRIPAKGEWVVMKNAALKDGTEAGGGELKYRCLYCGGNVEVASKVAPERFYL